jgi:hypothetical protein
VAIASTIFVRNRNSLIKSEQPMRAFAIRTGSDGTKLEWLVNHRLDMHWFCRAWRRHGNFEHTDIFILENNFVAVGCGLYGVVSVWEARFFLPVEVKVPQAQD